MGETYRRVTLRVQARHSEAGFDGPACHNPRRVAARGRAAGARPRYAPALAARPRAHPAGTLPVQLSRHLVLYGVVLVALQLAFRGWGLAGLLVLLRRPRLHVPGDEPALRRVATSSSRTAAT